MNRTAKVLAWISLAIALVGVLWSLMVYVACGMTNVPYESRGLILYAFPLPALAVAVSICSLFLAKRGGTSPVGLTGVPPLLIAACNIILAFLFWRSYP